ncbi:hypothetical protein Tco_1423751, partial [Tanacetum coccineum]
IQLNDNLKAYDGTTGPDDHLTIFMGTMDMHKLPELAWCRFFHITLSGATRFWANEANVENRLRDSRWVTNDGKFGQNYRATSRRHKDKYVLRPNTRPNERPNIHEPSFTPLIKSPAEIYATSEGKAILRPPVRMFAPAYKRDRTSEDLIPEHCNDEDPLVITACIGGCVIHRVYVNGGSSAEIMYEHCFQQLTDEIKESMQSPTSPLIGFARQVLWPLGVITIPLTLSDCNGKGRKMITQISWFFGLHRLITKYWDDME